jgi:hypothetical protein
VGMASLEAPRRQGRRGNIAGRQQEYWSPSTKRSAAQISPFRAARR